MTDAILGGSGDNIAFGSNALASVTTGQANVCFGTGAGFSLTSGGWNVCIGTQAGTSLTTNAGAAEPASNVLIGKYAGKYLGSTGDGGNVCIGENAGGGNSGVTGSEAYRAVAIGANALASLTNGSHNTAIGDHALAQTTTGGSNAAGGRGAGNANTTGAYNTFFGHAAGYQFTTGSNNTFVGDGAGNAGLSGLARTGSDNVAVGEVAGPVGAADSFTIAIGSGATVSGSNKTVIGRGQTQAHISGRLSHGVTVSAVSAATAHTYTTEDLLGGLVLRSGCATISDTLPSAADIVAAIPGCEHGAGLFIEIQNNGTGTLGLTAGAGVSLVGTTSVASGFGRRYLVQVTNGAAGFEAVQIVGIMTGAA